MALVALGLELYQHLPYRDIDLQAADRFGGRLNGHL